MLDCLLALRVSVAYQGQIAEMQSSSSDHALWNAGTVDYGSPTGDTV